MKANWRKILTPLIATFGSLVIIDSLFLFVAPKAAIEFSLSGHRPQTDAPPSAVTQSGIPPEYHSNFPRLVGYTKADVDRSAKYPTQYFSDFKSHNLNNNSYDSILAIKNGGPTIYSVRYSFDQYGRRGTGTPKTSPKKNVLCLGDSLTLGEGLRQGADYPSMLNSKLGANFQVHNFGWHGNGVNDVFLNLDNKTALDGVKSLPTDLVWLYIADHLNRFFCPLSCERNDLFRYVRSKPKIARHGSKIEALGTFRDDDSPFRLLLSLLSHSALLKAFNIEIPFQYSKADLELFADTFVAVRDKIASRVPVKNFFLISPVYQDLYLAELRPILEERGIRVIDLDRYHDQINFPIGIPLDGHPTSEFNWFFTDTILSLFST